MHYKHDLNVQKKTISTYNKFEYRGCDQKKSKGRLEISKYNHYLILVVLHCREIFKLVLRYYEMRKQCDMTELAVYQLKLLDSDYLLINDRIW